MLRIQGLDLGRIGFGCLQLESLNQETDAVEVIVEAYSRGIRMFDTAAAYGADRHNERVLAQAITRIKEIYGKTADIFFSTKCGINFAHLGTPSRGYETQPEQIIESVNQSLSIFGVSQLPLLYLHRLDPESGENELLTTFTTLKNLVEEGKIKYIGLSECSAKHIKLADEVFKTTQLSYNPFAFVQSACSVGTTRAFGNGVLQECKERGIQFVSYTSMVRGLVNEELSDHLTLEQVSQMDPGELISNIQTILHIPENEFRFLTFIGFFQPNVVKQNITCILKFQRLAKDWSIKASSLALAWQVAGGMLPIPGTSKIPHLIENIHAGSLSLTKEQVQEINSCFEGFSGNPNINGMLDDSSL